MIGLNGPEPLNIFNMKFESIQEEIDFLDLNLKRVLDGIDDYGNNDMFIKMWTRELKILKILNGESIKITR